MFTLYHGAETKFVVFYSSKTLLDGDKPKFDETRAVLAGVRYSVPTNRRLICKDTDIDIIDEVDHVLIDMQCNIDVFDASSKKDGRYKQSLKTPIIIGLTATRLEELDWDEKLFLTRHHSFNYFCSTIPMSFSNVTLFRSVDEFVMMT